MNRRLLERAASCLRDALPYVAPDGDYQNSWVGEHIAVIKAIESELAKASPDSKCASYSLNRDQSVAVAKDFFYTKVTPESHPSIGTKVIVADIAQGIGYLRPWDSKSGWTHFAPMPRFDPNE
jgi:hypothetical protein